MRATLRTGASAEQGPAIRTTAMPADTNPAGDIFGGEQGGEFSDLGFGGVDLGFDLECGRASGFVFLGDRVLWNSSHCGIEI